MLFLVSCKDEDLAPVATFDTLSIGAFPRLQELVSGEYDLNDLDNSAYEYVVDFVDENKGGNVASYDIYVRFIDNNPGNGDLSAAEMLYKSFGPSDFSTNATGNPEIRVRIPLSELQNKFGLDNDDLVAGDQFCFRTEVIKEDGRVFTSQNSTPAVSNAFGGYFNFCATVTCPLDDGAFTGDYAIEYIDGDQPAWLGFTLGPDGTVLTLREVPGSSTRRTFTFDWEEFGAPTDMDLNFVCDVVIPGDGDTGLGCGGGSIVVAGGDATPFDFNDDSEFTLMLIDLDEDGGCGVAAVPFTVRLTKQ